MNYSVNRFSKHTPGLAKIITLCYLINFI